MAREQDNTVNPSLQQVVEQNFFKAREGSGKKVLFAGNSITRHCVAAEIGWDNCWGMAASAEEKDYVHLVAKRFEGAQFGIATIAGWERGFWDPEVLHKYDEAVAWQPDIVVFRAGENTPNETLKNGDYAQALAGFMRFINPSAKYVVTGLFWKNEAREALIQKGAELIGAKFVKLDDLGEREEMTAAGKFWHGGVACHPGDLGMEKIAERIAEALKPLL